MITFDEAIKEDMPFVLSPGRSSEIRGYFTNARVDRDTVPEGWNVYDFRTTENGNLYCLEEHVAVNHGGCFLTKQKIPMKNGRRCLSGRGGYTFE